MAKPEWGMKRTCPSCGARFYDLQKNPAVCPKCGTKAKAEPAPRGKRPPKPAAEPAPKPAAEAAPAADGGEELEAVAEAPVEAAEEDLGEVDDLAEGEEAQGDIIEDTSDLGEDEEDMSEVIEHLDEDVEDKT